MDSFVGRPFPRIPLSLKLPEEQPYIKKVSGYIIKPHIDEVSFNGPDLELKGRYLIKINYYGETPCSFFHSVFVSEGGVLIDNSSKASLNSDNLDIYSWSWEDSIHTFIETKKTFPSELSLVLKVNDCYLEIHDSNTIKGYLVLALDKKR